VIRYVPFLKAKRGELTAMGELAPGVKQAICPFFDFPRKKPDYSAEAYAATARSIATSLKKHWGADAEFYFDDLDIAQTFKVEGEHQYAYVLKVLQDLRVIPVVALDRIKHNDAVVQLKRDGEIASATVAFRAEQSDFEDFEANEDQIDYDLANVFKQFEAIDLVLDCRLCTGINVLETAQQIVTFAKRFCAAYDKVRRVIVTGSSLPASIRDVLSVDSTEVVARRELAIISKARDLSDIELVAGDYTTVSPFYSDADLDPKIMPNVMTPRLIYPFRQSYYIMRGVSMKSGGYEQYVDLTLELCGQDFFRPGYSTGEDYFYEKSQRIGKNAMNGTVVKPSVVAHITYMVLGAKI
jgi:T4 beta protein